MSFISYYFMVNFLDGCLGRVLRILFEVDGVYLWEISNELWFEWICFYVLG